jgi:hypothetical protein
MKRLVTDILKSYLMVFLLFFLFVGACGDKENIVVFTYSEVIRLLSNDSSKSWDRKAMTIDGQAQETNECDLYSNTIYIHRNDSLIYIITSQSEFCGGEEVVLDSGYWDVIEESVISDRIDRIAYYSLDGDTTYKDLKEITSVFLTLESDIDDATVQESFESSISD